MLRHQLDEKPVMSSPTENLLQRSGARTREDLQEAIAIALDLITPQDALDWFPMAAIHLLIKNKRFNHYEQCSSSHREEM